MIPHLLLFPPPLPQLYRVDSGFSLSRSQTFDEALSALLSVRSVALKTAPSAAASLHAQTGSHLLCSALSLSPSSPPLFSSSASLRFALLSRPSAPISICIRSTRRPAASTTSQSVSQAKMYVSLSLRLHENAPAACAIHYRSHLSPVNSPACAGIHVEARHAVPLDQLQGDSRLGIGKD